MLEIINKFAYPLFLLAMWVLGVMTLKSEIEKYDKPLSDSIVQVICFSMATIMFYMPSGKR